MQKIFLIVALCTCCLFQIKAQKAGDRQQPNVVFILADDLGWTDLGCYGATYYQTPNIDLLASQGVRFTNAYAACTVCSPTRASILTGKYPATINCTDYIPGKKYPYAKMKVPDWTMYLDTAEVTIAELFKANGYATGHIGKWHLGDDPVYWPENQGFDVNKGGWAKGAPIRQRKIGTNGFFSPYGNPRLEDGPAGEYLTERLADEACTFIQEHQVQPFFLNVWLYSVHLPLQAKTDKIEKYEALKDADNPRHNPTYAAMVEHMDEAVGQIRKTLKKLNLHENTIIVFTSDNGGLIGNAAHHKENITSNAPLRSGKGDRYEGGIRVPCIFSYPQTIRAAWQDDTPICSPDFFPTLVEMANLETKHVLNVDGVSLNKLLRREKPLDKRDLFWHYPHYHNEGAVPYSAVRSGDYKLIHNLETNRYELYDLSQDVGEQRNLAGQQLDKGNELKVLLEDWTKQVAAQMPDLNPQYDAQRADYFERNNVAIKK